MPRKPPGPPIDTRQRLAAVAVLMAFDLPVPMHEYAEAIDLCDRILPGVKMDQLPLDAGRLPGLKHARRLIDDMLRELGDGAA